MTSKVSYEKRQREKAKELKRPLFTVDIPGAQFQGPGDDELVKDLLDAMLRFTKRQSDRRHEKQGSHYSPLGNDDHYSPTLE